MDFGLVRHSKVHLYSRAHLSLFGWQRYVLQERAPALCLKACNHISKPDFKVASILAEQALRIEPLHPSALLIKALCMMEICPNSRKQAIAIYQSTAKLPIPPHDRCSRETPRTQCVMSALKTSSWIHLNVSISPGCSVPLDHKQSKLNFAQVQILDIPSCLSQGQFVCMFHHLTCNRPLQPEMHSALC